MRKKLNLAISVFLFVLVFSFFSVPVYASSSTSLGSSTSTGVFNDHGSTRNYYLTYYSDNVNSQMSSIDLSGYTSLYEDDVVYRVNVTSVANLSLSCSNAPYISNFDIDCVIGGTVYNFNHFNWQSASTTFTNTQTFDVYMTSDITSIQPYFYGMFYLGENMGTTDLSVSLTLTYNSITPLTAAQTDEYQSGYNAGYSDGLSQGQSSGYNSGYSDGYTAGQESVDTDGLYESGYQAGVDSVDTQSYYDAGYSNGYSGGYSAGYNSGYNTGYSDAVAAIEDLGADMSQYPIEMTTFYGNAFSEQKEVYYGEMHDITFVARASSFSDSFINKIDPHHTYCFSGGMSNFEYAYSNLMNRPTYDVILEIGGCEYVIASGSHYYSDSEFNFRFFIPGDRMSTGYSLKYRFYDVQSDDEQIVAIITAGHSSFMGYVADYGPANSEQNHIANQTDELTNGYDSSAGSAAASSLASGSADYTSAESNLFASATSSLGNFSFVDISAFPQVISGISFVSSIMTGIFDAMGGANGAGIVLSVLFSVMFVSMVVGIYRWYQSGGKGGRSKGGGK